MALTIHDPITKTSFVIVKHLPEIAYYNFSTSVPSQNPANRPVPYPCKGNDYLISGTCKNSNEYTIPLKAKPLTIKERFIDIPEINGKQKPYTNFNTINVPLFCESLRVSSEQMYLDCMSQLKCEVSLMKSSMSKYSMLFTNFLYSALFLVDETNVVTIIAVQPNYNSESELFVKVINEIKMIGTIQYLYISPNGQHMITPISRRKWELDSIERQVKVCAALDANPNNQFLKPFEEACDSMPQLYVYYCCY